MQPPCQRRSVVEHRTDRPEVRRGIATRPTGLALSPLSRSTPATASLRHHRDPPDRP